MAPTPQEVIAEETPPSKVFNKPLRGHEVVISGMSGIFPKSNSVSEFMDNLFNNVDMVTSTEDRWDFAHPEVPRYLGKVEGMTKFDAQFFRVHYKQACTMEPMSRKLLEHSYGAIFDSGINPLQLRGQKVGVFIGSTFSESEKIVIYETIQQNGFGITGCNRSMYANRISYWIDGKGPSYSLDVASASSMACLEHAYRSISTGQCDAAIVGGCNLCMHPNVSLNMKRAGFLCMDGKSKCYDKNADGYVRSDAVSVLFLQKAKYAKRIYSEVYYAKANYGKTPSVPFMSHRHPKDIEDFLQAFYSEIDVCPRDVEFIEGHGSGNMEADSAELEAIGKVFAKDKTIKIGSVVSNMGFSDPASGVCALTKACIAYHKGELPANLHFSQPIDSIQEMKEGKIQVLQENTPFNRGFLALNTFSYSGANIHILLNGRYKKKDPERYKTSIPYLVLSSGRLEEGVKKFFDILKGQPIDPEQIGLLHNIHEHEIPGHMCRGYILLDPNQDKETVNDTEKVDIYPEKVSPVWFVYSGMGSQWATMGAGLMRIPIFAAAIEKCHRVLEPKGINIMHILTNPDKTIYDNILHSFVGIAAVQIGLTDVLKAMGIVPDNIIGHSVGELGCAYADGCFTAEEMILSAYSRGLVSIQTPFIKGSMAAVGLGYETVLPLLPPEIEVACHNSSESSTISGPADIMKSFVAELSEKGVFAKEVPCSNIAYHSKYIAGAGPALLKYLSEVIKEPKRRSLKWVSTSVPRGEWTQSKAKYSSAEYHTNNLLSPVLFAETAKFIPKNAIVIEIAPHGLLQAILKRSLGECTHIPLTRKGTTDPIKYLLDAVGKLYIAGLNPKVKALYPQIEYPVSTETPMLSHLVSWEHSENWPEAKFNAKDRMNGTNRVFVVSIHDDDYKYYEGHVRDGMIVFPEAAVIFLVWETLAMYKGVDFRTLPVIFKNVNFHAEANLNTETTLKMHIAIQKGSNRFEVSCNDMNLVSGIIEPAESSDTFFRPLEQPDEEEIEIKLTKDDIYKIMHLRGFGYKGKFQSLHASNVSRTVGNVIWDDDWVTYLDALIQLTIFSRDVEGLSSPKIIKSLTIDPEKHAKVIEKDGNVHTAQFYKFHGITRCGGVELDKIEYNEKPPKERVADVIETQSFIPHFLKGVVNLNTAVKINIQVIAENISDTEIKAINVLTSSNDEVSKIIEETVTKTAAINMKVTKMQPETVDLDSLIAQKEDLLKANLFIAENLLGDVKKLQLLHGILSKNSFVMTFENNTVQIHPKYKLFHVVTVMNVQTQSLILLKKSTVGSNDNEIFIPIKHDKTFSWVPRIQTELQKSRRVILVSEKQPYCGLIGLVKKLRDEYGNKIGLVVVNDYNSPPFHPDNSIYKEQLRKNLTFNIFNKGQWGGYYYLTGEKWMNFTSTTPKSVIPGNLDTLTWVETPQPKPSHTVVKVHYAGISSKDVSRAMGQEKGDGKSFGMDFSGLNSNGEKVMGLLPQGALSSTVEADLDLLWPVPDHWSLEDAATVPLPFFHAFYCLAAKGSRLLQKTIVFVNGGAGALGQAVISICISLGCTVYTAVSDIKKKKFLLRLFPELNENNIGNSRDGSFVDMIVLNTQRKNCDFVINTATGPMREAAMKCCGFGSKFIDVSDFDMKANRNFGMFFLSLERNYYASNMSTAFKSRHANDKKLIQILISDGIRRGIVRPLSRVVYAPNDVTKAFRLLSASKQRGRVLLRLQNPKATSLGFGVVPRMEYSTKGTHIVVCDGKGLGIELIDHLVKRGARKLLVLLKPNTINGYLYTKLMSWKKLGVYLQTFSDPIHTEKACIALLNEASELGPIEGIFVVQDVDEDGGEDEGESFEPTDVAKKFNEASMVVANLDLLSRNVCNGLKHFVVLTRPSDKVTDEYNTAVSEKICQMRNDAGLPGLAYHVGKLNEPNKNSKESELDSQRLSYSAVFSALETSLKLNYKNVQAFNLRKRPDDEFVRKIEKILGVANINDLPEDLTLEKLTLNEMNKEEIIMTIKDAYNISYTIDKLDSFTVGCIKNLSNSMKMQDSNFNIGLGAFFGYIDNDEWLATEPIIPMPSQVNMAIEKEEELEAKEDFLMMIPGFEGHRRIFGSLSERLKLQALTFQLDLDDSENESISRMAAKILKFVKTRFELKSKFYLLGYSFGVNVALELAVLLEKEGHVGIVFCLDGSPDSLRAQLDAYVGNLSDSQLQNAIVDHLYHLMTGERNEELKKKLETIDDWSLKVETCVTKLRGLAKYSNQYKQLLLHSAYRRIILAKQYHPEMKLESEIVLIKGIPHPKIKKLPEDYNLSRYTKRPVQIFNIPAVHDLTPFDSRVTNIINRMLDPEILEDFKKKNLCEVYFADPAKFL